MRKNRAKLLTVLMAAVMCTGTVRPLTVCAKAYKVVEKAESEAEAKKKASKVIYTRSSTTKKNARTRTYGYKYTRGIRFISCVEDHMDWRSDGKKILSSSAFQTVSGMCASGRGIRRNKVYTTKSVHAYDGAKSFTFGIKVKNITIGFTKDYVDRLLGYSSGGFVCRPNV